MKRYLFLLALLTLGCQHSEPETVTEATGGPIVVQKSIVDEPLLNYPGIGPTNISARTSVDVATSQKQVATLNKKLAEESPFSTQIDGEPTAIDLRSADQAYLLAAKRYSNDQMLPLFQQRYARIMLRQYGGLAEGDTRTIIYYTSQLIEGKSNDYPLIADGLKSIKSESNPVEFNRLLAQAIMQANQRKQIYDLLNERLDKAIALAGPENKTRNWTYIQLTSWKELKRKLAAEQITESLDRLEQMAGS